MRKICLLISVLLLLASLSACASPSTSIINTEFILTTSMRDGKFIFLGVDGNINGLENPVLRTKAGEQITITLINSGQGQHDIVFPELNVQTRTVSKKGETTSISFTTPDKNIALRYYDSIHEKLGMGGVLLVGDAIIPDVNTVTQLSNGVSNPPGIKEYTLETAITDGKMVYIGKGGSIEGKVNPNLSANPGDNVIITLVSGDGALHNINIDEFKARSSDVTSSVKSIELEFTADKEGTYKYYCSVPGHRQAGMEGNIIVGSGVSTAAESNSSSNIAMNMPTTSAGPADPDAQDITHDPADIPEPVGNRGPETVQIELETREISGLLADGTSYRYWTFNGTVPGPLLRIRLGDTVEIHLKNNASSSMIHSIDLHAVTGPGGGAVMTQTKPGNETMFTFKALNPGVYVYHCATPMVADHISNGMYGLILVEPAGGLPPVDHEFYVMQGELYTNQPYGTLGALTSDTTKLLAETPEYFVFNGAALALAGDKHALHAKVGDTIRIFFGVGGPNFTSSFHIIGEIFDRVFNQASLTSNPLTDIQTTMVPPGGATMVEFKVEVPGRYILVDHALSRLQRGLAGYLYVEGDPVPEIFDGIPVPGSGH